MAPTPSKKIAWVAQQKIVPAPKKKIASVASVAFMHKRDQFSTSPKEMKQQDILGFLKTRAPPVLSIELLNHREAKYSRLRGWQSSGTVLYQPINQQKELANLSIDLDTAIVKKEWKRAESIQVDVDRLKQSVDTMRKDLEEAKGALKDSLLAFQYLIKQGKHVEAGEWDKTVAAGTAVLAEYFQCEAKRASRKKNIQTTVGSDASGSSGTDTEEEEDDELHAAEVEVVAPHNLNPFDPAEKSHATRQRIEKRSVATGKRAPKRRKLDEYIARPEFNKIMNAPWTKKTRLGPPSRDLIKMDMG
jgi:hypothetical protein